VVGLVEAAVVGADADRVATGSIVVALVETVAFGAGVETTPATLADEVEVLVTFGATDGVDVDADRVATGSAVVALAETVAFVAGVEATAVTLAGELEVLVVFGATAGFGTGATAIGVALGSVC
jgi:hypothetical protein